MGKFIPARDFVFGTEKEIRTQLKIYNDEIHLFEQKNIKRSGVKARRALGKLRILILQRRKEILGRLGKIKHRRHEDGEFC